MPDYVCNLQSFPKVIPAILVRDSMPHAPIPHNEACCMHFGNPCRSQDTSQAGPNQQVKEAIAVTFQSAEVAGQTHDVKPNYHKRCNHHVTVSTRLKSTRPQRLSSNIWVAATIPTFLLVYAAMLIPGCLPHASVGPRLLAECWLQLS